MRNKLFVIASLLIAASMVLGACATPTPQTVVQTVEVVKTVEVQVPGELTTQIVTATPPPAAPPAEFKSKDPNTFTYVTFGDAASLDPALNYENFGNGVIQNTYDTLIFQNKESAVDFVPQLATEVPSLENGGISSDGKTYTFKIRPNVKFHNGDVMTPSDVAYTFQRGLLQGGSASPQLLLTEPFLGSGLIDVTELIDPSQALIDSPEELAKADPAKLKEVCDKVMAAIVADDAAGTVTMNLAQGWGPFLPTLAQSWGSVMDKKWVIENKGWDGSCDTWQNYYGVTDETDPIKDIENGTGPFKLENWTKGQELSLVRNDDYWRTEPAWEGGPSGPAKLQRVVYKEITETGTRIATMQAGDGDFLLIDRQFASQVDPMVGEDCIYDESAGTYPACTPAADPSQTMRLWKGAPLTTRTDVFFNFNIANPEGGNPMLGSGKLDGNGIPPDFFNDEHVRKAFEYCFDWDTFNKDALVGEAIQSVSISLPGEPGYDPNGPKYTFDAAKCEEEFKASTLKSPDGKSLWDTGFRVQIGYNQGNVTRQTVAEILAANLAQVNDKFLVDTVGLPWPSFLAAQRAKTLPVFISGWAEDFHDPHNWYVPYILGTYGGRQSLPAEFVDQAKPLISQGVAESDPAKRAEIYKQLNQLVYDYASLIILSIPTQRHYEQRWVNGYYYNPIFPDQYFYPLSKN